MTSRALKPCIVKTSPPAEAGASRHPRRQPAYRSVSLLHSRRSSSESSRLKRLQKSDSSASHSPSSLQPLGGKGSSGESSSVERWFEQSNNEVRGNRASITDNDPPFFMRNSSSGETPPDGRQKQLSSFSDNGRANSLPFRTGLLQLGTDGSSMEEYRGVIDDLTIENQRLKRQLKKYKSLHDSHLKDDKLFEVRIHGLPPEKKRELEETLRKFTSSLGPTAPDLFPANGYEGLLLKPSNPASSHTSFQRDDSGYGSLSAAGPESGSGRKKTLTPTQYLANRQKNIHSYLHDIPEGLLPKQNPAAMTERTKRRLVVRKLEQLFAGKGAAVDAHQQSLQQQEVSQSAARTDSSAREAAGQRARQEGNREAHIMRGEMEEPLHFRQAKEQQLHDRPTDNPQSNSKEEKCQSTGDRSPGRGTAEQRPTRPLDLDPHRAQVPAENIRYMRHLGFSPRNPDDGSPKDGHGWIYLNFLINMAQLHTINVTTDFVRKALSDRSDKFEVSNDGRKVRWRGGHDFTRNDSSGEGSSREYTSDNTPEGRSPRKRTKLSQNADSTPTSQQAEGALQRSLAENKKHVYNPLFFRRARTDEDDGSSSEAEDQRDESMSSHWPTPLARDSSGLTTSGIQPSSGLLRTLPTRKRKKRDNGPIIFYNNASFCIDLSGDITPNDTYTGPPYVSASTMPIGQDRQASGGLMEKRSALAKVTELPEPIDFRNYSITDPMELSLPPQSPSGPETSTEQQPIDFEASGIGGVWPTDNFAIFVQTCNVDLEDEQAPDPMANFATKPLAPRLASILHGWSTESRGHVKVETEIVNAKVRRLRPSELPPALGFFDGDSMGEDESDVEDMFDESEFPATFPPSVAPQPAAIRHASSEEDDEEVDDEEDDNADDDTDGEVDFLAAAREIDPEAVRQKEREYDANMADRLAEEIPAGSSAATAGGGSGFASPVSERGQEERLRARKDARAKYAILKRDESKSAMFGNMKDISDSDDEEEESDEDMSDASS